MLALLRLNQRRITSQIPHNTTSYLCSTLKFCTQPPSSSQDDSLILRNKTTSYSCSISELCSQPQQPSQNDPIDINTITRIINDHPFPDQPLHPTLLRHLPPSTITTPLVENVLGRLFASHCNGLKALEFFNFTLHHSHTPPSPSSLEKTLHILTRMRYFEKAWGLLKEIGRTHPSLLTLKSMSIMLSKVAKYQSFEDTLEAFRRMELDVFVGRVFGTDEFNVLLKAFCTQRQMKEARSVFAKMVPRFCANTKTMNILLLGFKESGDVTSVELFYHEMVKRGFSPDGVTYNIRIDAYCKKGCFGDALRILEEMEQRGFVPTIETITTLIHGAGLVRNRGKALQLFKEIHLRNLVADTGAYNALISSLIRMKDIESALLVMDEMVEKHVKLDGLTYHTLFLGLKRSKGVDGVSELYHKMTQRNFVPETRTVVTLMKYFCQNSRVDLGLSLWRYMVEKGYCPHSHALDLLVSGLCSRGLVEEAFECSKQLLERGRHMSTAAFLMMERFLLKAGDMAKLKELDCMIKKLQSVLPPSRGHATVLTNLRKHPNWNLFFSTLQGQGPAGGNSAVVTSSSSHIPSQQIPSASTRGVASGYRSTIEYNACQMKDSFMPSPSPYDLSSSSRSQTTMIGDGELQRGNQPLIGGSMIEAY